MSYGEEGIWKRAHRTPRRALFTPHRVAGGPGWQTLIGRRRTTIGKYVGSGKKFEIVNDYHDPNHNAHRIIANAWIVTLEFRVMNVDSESEMSTGAHGVNSVRAIGALSSLCARP